MTGRARRVVRDLVPPAVVRALTGGGGPRLRFADGYADWSAASAAAGTYSESTILDRVRAATDEVVAGRAAYERDGVTFAQHEYNWPVTAALLWRATLGPLRVIDFGGSLGSSFRQVRPLLNGVDVAWGVVEQRAFVEAGRAYEDGQLRFFDSIHDCVEDMQPTVALASGVLQYLPHPFAVIDALRGSGCSTIIIDRTPVVDGSTDLPIVQRVPPEIYEASYPAWLFGREHLVSAFDGWDVVAEFPALDAPTATTSGVPIEWLGLVAVRTD